MRRSGARCRPPLTKGMAFPSTNLSHKCKVEARKCRPGLTPLSHLWNEPARNSVFALQTAASGRDYQSRSNCSAGPTFDGCAGYGCPRMRALMDQPSAAVLQHGGGLGRLEFPRRLQWPPGGRTDPPSVVRRTLHPSRRTPCMLLLTCLPPGKANPNL
jgi:hypothetical protein